MVIINEQMVKFFATKIDFVYVISNLYLQKGNFSHNDYEKHAIKQFAKII